MTKLRDREVQALIRGKPGLRPFGSKACTDGKKSISVCFIERKSSPNWNPILMIMMEMTRTTKSCDFEKVK